MRRRTGDRLPDLRRKTVILQDRSQPVGVLRPVRSHHAVPVTPGGQRKNRLLRPRGDQTQVARDLPGQRNVQTVDVHLAIEIGLAAGITRVAGLPRIHQLLQRRLEIDGQASDAGRSE